MDNFNVPKKVNRHVLKAITTLTNGDSHCQVSVVRVIAQVKYQMRNLIPVHNLPAVVRKSLKNLSDLGVINRISAHRFTMPKRFMSQSSLITQPRPKTPPISPTASSKPRSRLQTCPVKVTRSQVPTLFPPNGKKPSDSRLNPNARNVAHSSESISGDEFERTRKRYHTNTRGLKYSGRRPVLPKHRVPRQNRKRPQQHFLPVYDPDIHDFGYGCHQYCCHCMNNHFPYNHHDMIVEYDNEFYSETTESTSNSRQDFMFASLSPVPSIKITEIIDDDDDNDINDGDDSANMYDCTIIKEEKCDDDDASNNCTIKEEKSDDGDSMKKTDTDLEAMNVKMEEACDDTVITKDEGSICASQATDLSLSKSRHSLKPTTGPQRSVSENPVSSTSHFYIT